MSGDFFQSILTIRLQLSCTWHLRIYQSYNSVFEFTVLHYEPCR
jgi:hypothetical protein